MALSRARVKDLPPDAIVLNEQEAIKYQTKIVKNWKDNRDVFAVKYGSYFLGFASLCSGIYFNNFFKRKFKVGGFSNIAYLPVCVLPSVFTVIMHQELVLRDVLLVNENTCSVCLEVKAASLQAVIGFGIPAILSPISNISLAASHYTYNVPYITQEPLKVFSLIMQKMKPLHGTMIGLLAAHMVLASLVTYYEADSIFRIHKKMFEMEQTNMKMQELK